MKFETPGALWALASLVFLILFSLWRQGAQRVTVPSLLLWKKIPERNPPVRALRRPRWRLELLLQALAIAAAVAGLAGPYRDSDVPQPRRIAIVLDTSARMAAGGRLEKSKADAMKLREGALKNDRVTFYDGSRGPRSLPRALDAVPVDAHVDLAPILAAAKLAAEPVLLYSDRAVPGTRLVAFDAPADNVGIVELSVSEEEVFVRLVNHGASRAVPIEMTADDRPYAETKELPRGPSVWSRKGDYSKVQRVRVTLAPGDSFPMDDVAEATRLGSATTRVSLTGLHHEKLVSVFKAISGIAMVRGEAAAEVSVGWDEPPAQAALRVWIHSPSPRLEKGTLKVEAHALTADLEKRTSELAGFAWGAAPPGDPLITLGGKAVATFRGREVHVSVDLNEWQKVESFPIFWTNVIDYARKGVGTFAVVRAGKPARLPRFSKISKAPPGASWSLNSEDLLIAHTVGDYILSWPEGSASFRVNLLDERESDTGGTAHALDWNPASSQGQERIHESFGAWAAGAALVFLVLAWLLQLRPE